MAKPPGVPWESWVDKVVNDARERGELDGLPGAGKPLPDLDKPHDELWWVRKKLRDEGVSYLPPALALRKQKEETLALVATARSEERVRELLSGLNDAIRELNRRPSVGPPSSLSPVDVEAVVASWRPEHSVPVASEADATPPEQPPRADGRVRRRAKRPGRGEEGR